ncbi:MAG: PspC domain-containing protein, partial [Prevotella sp.]
MMKKNISINIFGTIYAIDEDAYQLLDNYINGMKKYFGSKEGGEEIADDIEHRVAELLWEEKEKGMQAVSIETVRTIIDKIGNAAEIDANGDVQTNTEGTTSSGHSDQKGLDYEGMTTIERIKASVKSRRLYRNGKDKVLGGVCSGLAEYFGGYEVTIWRLATLLIFLIFIWADFAFFLLPGIYVALWVIIPEAKTHEDWLRMRGEEVNAENIKKQIMDEAEQGEKDTDCSRNSRGGGCLKLILIVFLFFLLLPLTGVFFGLIVGTVAMLMTGIGLISFPWHELDPSFVTVFNIPGIKPL